MSHSLLHFQVYYSCIRCLISARFVEVEVCSILGGREYYISVHTIVVVCCGSGGLWELLLPVWLVCGGLGEGISWVSPCPWPFNGMCRMSGMMIGEVCHN